ncbi:MAG: iron uptake system protein EfeO [Actinomycetota bacterium]
MAKIRNVSIVGIIILSLALTSCAKRSDSAASGEQIKVTSTNSECKLSKVEYPAGNITFSVSNEGSSVTEFYIIKEDGKTVVSEVENIGPKLSRDLIVRLNGGKFFAVCKPGMKGDGIDVPLTVTGGTSPLSAADEAALKTASENYAAFVLDESTTLVKLTKEFAATFLAGNDDLARKLYPDARMPWERIEPVAESFGDLDPRLDLREADLETGQTWTGWHRIEKDLWPPATGYTQMTSAERVAATKILVDNTEELFNRVQDLSFEPFQMANGAKELLDEVATGKVTGEEEIWSGTDLWDFQANVEGADKVFTFLESVVKNRDPKLASQLSSEFENIFTLLGKFKTSTGFTFYSELTQDQIKEFASAVNALAEPLSKLTAVVTM